MLLSVRDLSVSFGPIVALRRVSIEVHEQEIVCVLGPNGAGKSTLLRAISGLVPASRGRITFDGRSISGFSPARIARAGLVQCPEGRRLFHDLTVEENLRLGAISRRGMIKRSDADDDMAFVVELFPLLAKRQDQKTGTLSGGEQQMVALARGVLARPRVLLLDEPSIGLAPSLVERLFQAIPRIAARGPALLLVEQNARSALAVAGRGYVLRAGQVTATGDACGLAHYLESTDGYLG